MNLKVFLAAFCFFLVYSFELNAQKSYDVGLYLGGVNYYGEIGKKAFVAPNQAFFGAIGKLNFNNTVSLRASITYLTLADDDRNANDAFRGTGRGRDLYYSFEHTNIEGALALEVVPFSFFKNSGNPIDFYLYGGVGALYGDESYYPLSSGMEDVPAIKYGTRTRLTIPAGAGFKTFVGQQFMLGVEFAPRYALSDNLDGTEPDDDRLEPNRFSYFQGNDWYTYIGITLTYRIGKGNNAYCDCGL